jgi:hypothetical protein
LKPKQSTANVNWSVVGIHQPNIIKKKASHCYQINQIPFKIYFQCLFIVKKIVWRLPLNYY